ncbi:MAG: HAD-IA family hydrolase, partial [Clostridiales bacterium]|nr:HAD-IA family hydrolase [Clostridiales bacterium]
MIKAVLFDFDETLQDRTAAFDKYADAFIDEFFPGISDCEKQKRINDMIKTGNGGYVVRTHWFSELIKLWNWSNAPSAQTLASHYDDNFGFFTVVFDDAALLLKELRSRGIKTGVITNGPSVLQHTKMENSGLLPYCDIVVVSGDLPFAKPQPEIFEYTAEKLALQTNECIYVGDHPVNDIEGALSSGMKAIRMNWGWFKNKNLRQDVPVINKIYDDVYY